MVDVGEARSILAGFSSGLSDAHDLLARPALVVDIGPGEDASGLVVPVTFPMIVIACSPGVPDLPPRGPDVALTARSAPPSPWVGVEDPAAEAGHLARVAEEYPGAARTLIGVLRVGPRLGPEEGLVVESLAYSTLQSGPDFARWRASRPGPRGSAAAVGGLVGDPVEVSVAGTTLEVVLSRPEVHNAYNAAMRDGLFDAFTLALLDPALEVRLSGRGPSFCSGGDLTEFGTFVDPLSAHQVRTARSPARLLEAVSDRTVAFVHGFCAGSGIELPAFASRVVADPAVSIWLPEVAMGLIPGAGGTVSLPRRMGPARTAWLGLSGRRIGATEALAWGLVDSVEEISP